MGQLSHCLIAAPDKETAHVQELQQAIYHYIWQEIERRFFPEKFCCCGAPHKV